MDEILTLVFKTGELLFDFVATGYRKLITPTLVRVRKLISRADGIITEH